MSQKGGRTTLFLHVTGVRQTKIHTAEPLVPDPRPSEAEIHIAELKKYRQVVIIWQN
jgi:hypothetical protein